VDHFARVQKSLEEPREIKFDCTNGFLWEADEDMISGVRAFATNQLASTNQVIYSPRWSELMIFLAGGISLLVDRYTQAQNSQTRVVVDVLVGVAVRHANSFIISTGAAN
jgi:hypothetical protein